MAFLPNTPLAIAIKFGIILFLIFMLLVLFRKDIGKLFKKAGVSEDDEFFGDEKGETLKKKK